MRAYPFIVACLISRHLSIISEIKQVKQAEHIIGICSSYFVPRITNGVINGKLIGNVGKVYPVF